MESTRKEGAERRCNDPLNKCHVLHNFLKCDIITNPIGSIAESNIEGKVEENSISSHIILHICYHSGS